jgi:glycosyltransferase involved in cell wall biosynthesis
MVKKILFITSLYYPHIGGIETFVCELSEKLQKKGIETNILTKRWPENLSGKEFIGGMNTYRVLNIKSESDIGKIKSEISKIENEIKADIIHVVGMRRSLPILGLYLAQKWSVPLVVSYGGGEIVTTQFNDEETKRIWAESKEIAEIVTKYCDWNVTFSEDLSRSIKKVVSGGSIPEVIHAGINFEHIQKIYKKDYKKPFLFSLRRLVKSKGVDLSIECFNRIKNDYPDLDLIIAGDGEEREFLENLVKKYELSDRIHFIGSISLDEAYGWLKSAYLTLVPSRSEGGGIVNIEAQACGCPVIGSRAEGISEYTKENFTSLLFDIDNLDQFEICLRKLLSDQKLRDNFSQNSIQFAHEFDWENIVTKYCEGYNKIKEAHSKLNIFLDKKYWFSELFTDL